MTAEISAQAHGALFAWANPLRAAKGTPISVVFGNETAAKFAMSVAAAHKHVKLHATVGVLWQILSMHSPVAWAHAYSHMGEAMNELADSVVEHMAFRPEVRGSGECPCSVWCTQYSTAQIKLIYLLFVPDSMQHAYPATNSSRTSIQETAPATLKWGLPTAVVCKNLDDMKCRAGSTDVWGAERITVGSYNLHVAACGVQEARDKESFSKVFLERWWVCASRCEKSGNYGCQLWVSLVTPWATCANQAIIPRAADLLMVIAEPRLLVVRPGVVQWFMVTIFAAVIGGSGVKGDPAWPGRVVQGAATAKWFGCAVPAGRSELASWGRHSFMQMAGRGSWNIRRHGETRHSRLQGSAHSPLRPGGSVREQGPSRSANGLPQVQPSRATIFEVARAALV